MALLPILIQPPPPPPAAPHQPTPQEESTPDGNPAGGGLQEAGRRGGCKAGKLGRSAANGAHAQACSRNEGDGKCGHEGGGGGGTAPGGGDVIKDRGVEAVCDHDAEADAGRELVLLHATQGPACDETQL